MFEQSQLEQFQGRTRKPVSVIAGFVLQGALLSGALIFSLLITEAAPRLRFNSSLMAPPRARRNFIAIEQPTQPRRPLRVKFVHASALTTPRYIPRETVILDKPPAKDVDPIDAFAPVEIADGVFGGIGPNDAWLPKPEFTETELPAPPPVTVHNDLPSAPLRIGGDVAAARLIHKVQQIYPPLARQARIQGTVRLEAIISELGEIADLRVISGHPLLIQASLQAVAQWRYQPTLLNGEPVAVITTVEMNFRLGN